MQPTPPNKPTIPRWTRRKQDRPREILDAALALFLAHGYAATRLEDVAARAGITKGTLYLYFENKERLFLSAVECNTRCQLDGALAIVHEHQGSMESLIRILLTRWWDSVFSRTTGGLLKILISEAANFPGLERGYVEAVVEPLQAILTDVVHRGVERGEFRPLDARAVSRVPLANFMMLSLWRVAFGDSGGAKDPVLAVETTLDVYLRGLRHPDAC